MSGALVAFFSKSDNRSRFVRFWKRTQLK